jgi:competence protein ComEA
MAQQQTQGRMNVNHAHKEDFMRTPGISESVAQKIIEYRDQNGPFRSWQDLEKVPGLNAGMIKALKENASI